MRDDRDPPVFEPLETMPVAGDRIRHPDSLDYTFVVLKVLPPSGSSLWSVHCTNGHGASLGRDGYGWRILRREP